MNKRDILMDIVRDPMFLMDSFHTESFPALHRMVGFDQKNPHHHLSLLHHTVFVTGQIPIDHEIAKVAALFHDCGKVDTQVIENGKAKYHGHEKVGADLASRDLDGVFPQYIVDDICLLISLHMRPLGYINQPFGNKGVRRLIKKAQGNMVNIDDLLTLNEADIKAHTPEDVEKSMIGHNKLKNHINSVR